MSDQKGGPGDKRFGPKKPRATFGDVMLGIPAGRPGQREERGRPDERKGPPRSERRSRDDRERGRQQPPVEQRRDLVADPQPPAADTSQLSEVPPLEERLTAEPAAPAVTEPAAPPPEPAPVERAGGPREDKRPRERGGPHRGEKKKRPLGPLVVVKRLTGTIETRPLDAPTPAERSRAEHAAADQPRPSDETAPSEGGPSAASAEARSGEPGREAPAPTEPPGALYAEVPEKESFAEMFEAASKHEGGINRRIPRVGEKVSGTIFQLGADTAFLTLSGSKTEAMINLDELKDEEGILRFGVGDSVEAHVIEAGAKGIYISKSLPKGSATLEMLSTARAAGIPVEGLVLAVNKGGLEVAIGDVRAFCPVSQIDVHYVEHPENLVGERHKFKVMEVRGKKVVLSRRAVIDEELKALAVETRKSLAEGKVVRGKVTNLREFGAFVDLGGIEGMIPVSEIAHTRIGHPSEVLKTGDEVEVEVLRIEPPNPNSADKGKHKERITLSMRARQEDPWKAAAAELKEGSRIQGKVVRLQPFGAFVELRPGVDGLIHVSAMSDRRIAHPRDVVKVGQEVTVQVEKIDPAEKKIGLRLVREEESGAAEEKPAPEKPAPKKPTRMPRVGEVITGKVDRIEPYGVFLTFPGGQGLVPASETGTERGTDLKRHFQLGQELKAAVLEIDSGRKIRLSFTAAEKAEERASIEAWQQSQPKAGGGKGLGTFADLLKGKKLL